MNMESSTRARVTTHQKTDDVDAGRREALGDIVRYALLSAVIVAGNSRNAWAFEFADLSEKEAGSGVKSALERGAQIAVALLGKENGFWGNDAVRIALPDWLQKAERPIKLWGAARI